MAKKGGNMKNKTIHYTLSALFWFLVGVVSYQLYLFQNNKIKSEMNLIASANEIHRLHNLGFDKYEILRKREYSYDIVRAYNYERDKKVLDTIAMVENIADSLNMLSEIDFSNVEILYNRDYYQVDTEINRLKSLSMNENLYNKSNLYSFLYKNTLLTTLRGRNSDRYFRIVATCNFGRGMFDYLQFFDENKIGITDYAWYYSIAHCNYPKTTSTSFEFETVVEKLGRNPQTIRTRYRTTPKEGKELGIYDYEVIETIVEK